VTTVDLGPIGEFPSCEARRVNADGRWLVVVRVDDEVFALEDRCSHEEFALSDGEVDCGALEIECARHGAMFSLRDGDPQSLPATKPVASFAARTANGRVEVELS
jgi:3-phenylpropionate/trans-cinnamate dioxygenase ferredoxin subunit